LEFIRKVKEQINTDFSKNVLILLTGTGISQVIPILVSPILTRIYSPNDFGLLGLYVAFSSVLAVFSSCRYDLAIIEPKFHIDAKRLVVISIILSFLFSFLLLILIVFYNQSIANLLRSKDITNWLYLIPISVFVLSCYSIFSLWLNRKKKYKEMSVNRVISSTLISVFSLFLGIVNLFQGGLIIGLIFGQVITTYLLFRNNYENTFVYSHQKTKVLLKKYIHYPKYLLPSTFAGEISSNAPIILISIFYSSSITGFFSLASRVVSMPFSLIGNSIGEVYRQKAAEEYNSFGNCKLLYLETLKKMFFFSLVPFFLLLFFGKYLFSFVFGNEWVTSGIISESLAFLVFFQLISTPMAYTITFNKSQKLDFFLQMFRVVFSILGLFVGFKYFNDYIISIKLYSFVYCVYYILHSIIQYRAAAGYQNNNLLRYE
jgi:O-antigen/teichoic acid export membrane protein